MIELKVVSPQKVIFQKEVEMAVLPGTEGDFAAMQDHSPFISSLRPGQMAIMSNNKTEESFFVSGGLVMLKGKICEVLVDQIESLKDLNNQNFKNTKTYIDLEENNKEVNNIFEQVVSNPSYK
ncbi:MAG: ATP synthase F1 subunit epsilon [Pelagibacteraceae bacterium]|jgi:F-type H+-transporting ATPase subunit epsilon|nr:ATP synthase F1 subunit epsilon [Pelagibacteraceae bacterium]|tara:strand:+ start:530 stop:898 length:369 start_codon:yes stop_codon:yes gene_type:complete